ncbi:TPA: ead/Ea22-like family protein [Citrobacter koseri]|uniref:ead/Ea22-like family protein n=1 Tax=Citrobacter koseri TaxID=545 RepID=UPI001A18545B|nr:ead/Ea22-like family protein [Citrobacter koseri]HDQ2605628.1 ead/Ea22-like family protein [Citrobacter koseri]
MSNIDKQALREIAEGVEREEWETLDNGDDGYQVIVKGSLERGETYRSYQPVSNEISERKIATFIAAFGPATVLALLDELEAAEQRIAELEAKLANPVLLPKTNGYWTEQEKAYEDAITLAKRQVRLAGFSVEDM